jgi:hypothetical protein
MRPAFALAMLALCAATPALATGGFECRPLTGVGPTLTIGLGHVISARPFGATIREGKRILSANGRDNDRLVIGQSWIDRQYLWLDLLDAKANRVEAKLRATFQPKLRYPAATGTLVRNGRTYRVRCIEA